MATMVQRLLTLSDELLAEGVHSLTSKRRAVSTAYYAVFHALAGLCADTVTGAQSGAERQSTNYERVYRALDHGPLRNAFRLAPLKDSANFRALGEIVVRLQHERHRSDYLPTRRLYSKTECATLIDYAKEAVSVIDKLGESDRQTLALSLLFKDRPL
jgi:hypothetical protein